MPLQFVCALQVYGEWPFSGEIDIAEGFRDQERFVSALHFGGPWDHAQSINNCSSCNPGADSSAWHVWALEWSVRYERGQPAATMVWQIDDREVLRVDSSQWWANQKVLMRCHQRVHTKCSA